MSQVVCESCGMPMRQKEEFGGGIVGNKYCTHCTTPEGVLKSFDEIVQNLKNLIVSRMDVQAEEALEMAKKNLVKMPAWQLS